jgi:alginate O-acetyltransferase complex protein AlgI
MLFNSFNFVYFILIVYPLYLILKHRYQNYLLLGASLFFYGSWDWRFLGPLLFTTTTDYLCIRAIDQARTHEKKKLFLVVSIVLNLGLLGYFKYFGFFKENLYALLNSYGIPMDMRMLAVGLPIGISFYTFQAIGYVVDVYRGKEKPVKNFPDFVLFITFFPQLVAGPIERAGQLVPQILNPRILSYEKVRLGFWLILVGFYKKLVISDNLAPFVDKIFSTPHQASFPSIMVGLYATLFMVYCDFSGYTDIARGVAKFFGIDLTINFRRPYLATNVADFWSRWHISMSSWFRDYLYQPLRAFAEKKGWRKPFPYIFASMLTMTLCGFWHRASWPLLLWGVCFGVFLSVYYVMRPYVQFKFNSKIAENIWRAFCMFVTFHLVTFAGGLFVIGSTRDLPILADRFVNNFAFKDVAALQTLIIFVTPLIILQMLPGSGEDLPFVKKLSRPARYLFYVAIFALIVFCGSVSQHQFYYYQF